MSSVLEMRKLRLLNKAKRQEIIATLVTIIEDLILKIMINLGLILCFYFNLGQINYHFKVVIIRE